MSDRPHILGEQWRSVEPPRKIDHQQDTGDDARTAALRQLKRYIQELTFLRAGTVGGPPDPFKIPAEDIYIEVPDNDQDLALPCVVFTQTEPEEYTGFGFQPQPIESSRDRYQEGTVLLHHYTQTETVTVEAWSGKKPERRAIISGLQTAFNPSQQYSGLRLRLPNYYDQVATFVVMSNMRPDEDTVRGRRIARMKVELRMEVVELIPYVALTPTVGVNVLEMQDPHGMPCNELQGNRVTSGNPRRPNPPNGWTPVPVEPKNQSPWWGSRWLSRMFPFKL